METDKIRLDQLERANQYADEFLTELSAMDMYELETEIQDSLNVTVRCDLNHGYRSVWIRFNDAKRIDTDSQTLYYSIGDQTAYRYVPRELKDRIDYVVNELFKWRE